MNTENNKKKKSGTFAFLWQHGKGVKLWFLLAFLTATVSIGANYLVPQVIRFTADAIIGADATALPAFLEGWLAGLGGLQGLRQHLTLCAAAIVAFSLVAGVFNFFSRLSIATATERFCRNLRNRLFRHVQYLPFKWHVENQTGDVIQRCTSDLEVVRNFVQSQLLEVARTIIQIILALVLMFSMNVPLSLVSLVFIPLIAGYSIIFYGLVGKRFLAADEAEGELTVDVQENLTGVRVVRAFGRERYELDRFRNFNNKFADLWLRLGRTLSLYWSTGEIATGLQIFSVVAAGAYFAVQGEITPGEYLVFVSYNQMLAWPIRSLGRTLAEMSKTGVSAKRIQQVLDAQEEPAEPNALQPDLHTDIRFENVTFHYDNLPVLQDLSFTIPAGSTFGILGATGSGKSTITYLLNRLYDLPEGLGNIWYGDTEVRQIDRRYLRRHVGVVLQEPFLFSKTIEENIAVAAKGAGREHVRHASRIADVDDAISGFSHGYDTVVGERGVTLSGGQKQRVAIARTLITQAPVMVFDDSLSAVDLETDARIRKALRENSQNATVVLISHRINTLMQADIIMVLENGRIAAIGTHAQLIEQPGLYKRIYDMQAQAGQQVLLEEPLAPAVPGGMPHEE